MPIFTGMVCAGGAPHLPPPLGPPPGMPPALARPGLPAAGFGAPLAPPPGARSTHNQALRRRSKVAQRQALQEGLVDDKCANRTAWVGCLCG